MLPLAVLSAFLAGGVQTPSSPPPRAEKADRGVPPRIGVESELVELDVVVTDGKDRPVTGLEPEDFEVLEDGWPRQITQFVPTFVARPGGAAPAAGQAPHPAAFPDESVPRVRHLVLAVDDYHLEPEDLASVRAALLRFIDGQLAAGDQPVVVAASGSLGALQQFTADRDVLRRAVGRLRAQNRSFRAPVDVPRMTNYQAELIESGDQEALELAANEIMVAERGRAGSTQAKQAQTLAEGRARALARQIVSITNRVTGLTPVPGAARAWPPPPPRTQGRGPLLQRVLLGTGAAVDAARAGGDRRRGRAVGGRPLHDRRARPHRNPRHRRRPRRSELRHHVEPRRARAHRDAGVGGGAGRAERPGPRHGRPPPFSTATTSKGR